MVKKPFKLNILRLLLRFIDKLDSLAHVATKHTRGVHGQYGNKINTTAYFTGNSADHMSI